MAKSTRILSAQPEALLTEADVRAIVRLLGTVAACRRDLVEMKQLLMDGLCQLISAGAWIWTLGCELKPGEQPVYLSMSHGGFDPERYANLLAASAHPDMAWISQQIIADMQRKQSHVTRLKQQLVGEKQFAVAGINSILNDADIGPFLVSLRPIDQRSVSTIGIYRRRNEPAFTERDSRIAHIVLTEVPWLHEQGWPEDRGATVPRLSPRLQLVLNLLLDGRSLKDIADHLSITGNTVAGYKKIIYRHFGVNSHAGLMRRFRLGDGGDH